MSRIYGVIIIVLLVCSCNKGSNEEKHEYSPLHDSIDVAVKEMKWDRSMQLIDKGEKTASNDIERYDMMLLRGGAYYYFGKPKELCGILKTMQPAVTKMESGDKGEQDIYMRYLHAWQVYYAQYTNDFDSMLYYSKKVKDYSIKIKNYRATILSISNLADVYRQSGNIIKAIEEYDNGIRLNDSIHADSALYLPMYSGMACSFNVLHNEKETDRWLDRMLSMSGMMTTIDSISYYTMKGNSLYFAGKYEESLDVFMMCDSLLQHHPDMTFDRIICGVNIADNYLHIGSKGGKGPKGGKGGDIDALLTGALDFFEKNNITAYSPYVHTLQILHLINQNKNAEALTLANKTAAEIPTMNPDHRVQRYNVMCDVMEANGRMKDAIHYCKLYENLDDSLRNSQTIAMTSEMESRYTRDENVKKQEIILQDKEIKEMSLYLLVSVLLLAVIAMACLFFYYRQKAQRKYESALNKIISLRGEIIHNRITPHFISNTLALGHNLTDKDIDSVIMLIRESLKFDDSLITSLDKEYELTKSFIEVASLTYSGTISLDVHMDESVDMAKVRIPAMSMLTIVENAVKHGTKDNDNTLHIAIDISKDRNGNIIEKITNSGALSDYTKSHDNAWHGLTMINKTIDLLNQKRHDSYAFDISNTEDGHVVATLTIHP